MDGVIYKNHITRPDFLIEIVDAREKYGPKYWWDPKNKPQNCRPRTEPIVGGVIHHQAGEGGATNVFHTLTARPKKKGGFTYLSVHFQIDQHGVITQLADLDTVCKHAGDANEWSWGVEIANMGHGTPNRRWPRVAYWDEMHGAKIKYLSFYDVQMEACLKLVHAVHVTLGLGTTVAVGLDGKALRRVLSKEERQNVEVFAHFNLTNQKPDPSPHLMDYLAANL